MHPDGTRVHNACIAEASGAIVVVVDDGVVVTVVVVAKVLDDAAGTGRTANGGDGCRRCQLPTAAPLATSREATATATRRCTRRSTPRNVPSGEDAYESVVPGWRRDGPAGTARGLAATVRRDGLPPSFVQPGM